MKLAYVSVVLVLLVFVDLDLDLLGGELRHNNVGKHILEEPVKNVSKINKIK